MSKGKFFYFSIGILFFLHGFVFAQTPAPTPENITASSESISEEKQVQEPETKKNADDLIHLGDLIDIDIVGSTEYDWRGKLSPEGFLSGVDYVDEPIYGLCKSEEEIALAVSKGFSKVLNNPKVVVRIIDRSGRPVSQIFGAVKTPQRFQIRRSVTLNELIILSGGITENARGEIQIIRPQNLSCQSKEINKEKTVDEGQATEIIIPAKQELGSQYISIKIFDLLKGKADANPLILPGDLITILESEPVYVVGGVVNPRQINANAQLTLSRAIDSAGGFTKDAETKNIIVFRRAKNEVQTIEVDFEKIKALAENDIVLQALDIIQVPQRGLEKNRFPPVIKIGENDAANNPPPPLRIID